VNGVPRYCDPYLWWSCACGGAWLSIFSGVPLAPGDEIAIILYPAPGALPELPGLTADDEGSASCCGATSVREARAKSWRLAQNLPNPFRPSTSIALDLDAGGAVRIDVLDVAGRHVRTLLDRALAAGRWSVTWDGRTDRGEATAAGTYFYRTTVDGLTESRRMVMLR
jgi:hypothetical protein